MKRLFFNAALIFTISLTSIQAEILETKSIEAILPYIEQDTLVLFNIAEVLTDSTISLGSSPSRKYIKALAPDAHDTLTWLIANKVPHKPVEAATPEIIRQLQEKGIAVAALTARGRNQWYTTHISHVDDVTENMLYSLDIDLKLSPPPIVSIQVEGCFYLAHYRNGIYYSDDMEKGEFLKTLVETTGYCPKNIILVDDKRDSLEDVEAALAPTEIPFTGFWYTRTKQDHAGFKPMVATLQLEHLIKTGLILSEAEAEELAATTYADVDPDAYFLQLVGVL